MLFEAEHKVNQAAYERLRNEIDAKYPKGRFVGFHDGMIVADAESYEAIDLKLNALGFQPLATMVVLAGDETPECVDFLGIAMASDVR